VEQATHVEQEAPEEDDDEQAVHVEQAAPEEDNSEEDDGEEVEGEGGGQ
jgi:hypothetical protein